MTGMGSAAIAATTLASGTYIIRLLGPATADRLHLTERTRRIVDAAAVVILFAVMATSALTDGHHLSDVARPAGVLVAIVLARWRVAFIVVVVAAALTTATVRLAGY